MINRLLSVLQEVLWWLSVLSTFDDDRVTFSHIYLFQGMELIDTKALPLEVRVGDMDESGLLVVCDD